MAESASMMSSLWRHLSKPLFGLGAQSRRKSTAGETEEDLSPLWMRVLLAVTRRMLLAPLVLVLTMAALVYGTTHNWGGLSIDQTIDDRPLTPASLGLYYRDVHLVTDDGVSLSGWHIPVWSADRLLRGDVDRSLRTRMPGLVICHGAWADRAQMLHLAPALHAAGYELLLIDTRGCGQSDGQMRLGLEEYRDVQAGVAWLQQVGPVDPQRIGVIATEASVPAALRAASQNPAIRVIVADRPCRDIGSLLRQRFDAMGMPGGTLGRLYEWSFSLGTARDLSEGASVDWARRLSPNQAVLVTARQDDEQIPSGDPLIVLQAVEGSRSLWVNPYPQESAGQPAVIPSRLLPFLDKSL